MMNTILQIF
ncbi:hypothetical protein AYI70_g11147, partial [Smittium culicis]